MSAENEDVQESLSTILVTPFSRAQEKPATDAKPAEKPVEKTAEKPAEVVPSAAEKEAKTRDDQGRFKAEEKPAEKPAEKPRADVAAIMDERRKRQDLERRLKEYEGTKTAAKPSVFDDEDKAISSRVDEGTRGLRETLYNQSVKIARLTYKDTFAEAHAAFAQAAEQDERLIEALRAADDPGEYIYTVGLQIRELADVGGDFVKYREKVTGSLQSQLTERDTRIKAMEAEIAALKQAQSDLETVPRSLNSTSSGAAPKAGEGDPEDIKDIARFGKPNTR